MQSWINFKGFPVISIRRIEDEKATTHDTFEIEQSRFTSLDNHSPDENRSCLWWIPIELLVCNDKNEKKTHRVTLKEKKMSLSFPKEQCSTWVKANAAQVGYYRTRYTCRLTYFQTTELQQTELFFYVRRYNEELEGKLAKGLPSLDTVDRLGIQNDAFALARSGMLLIHHALSLALSYVDEVRLSLLVAIYLYTHYTHYTVYTKVYTLHIVYITHRY